VGRNNEGIHALGEAAFDDEVCHRKTLNRKEMLEGRCPQCQDASYRKRQMKFEIVERCVPYDERP
jgi:hypothetical protein